MYAFTAFDFKCIHRYSINRTKPVKRASTPLKPIPKLQALWRGLDLKQRMRFAKMIGRTAGSFRHVVDGRRGVSSELAIKIEKTAARMQLAPIERTDLNEACRRCEYARFCRKADLS
jgi:plasmid maintenance system antidote protein VapI